MRERGGKRILRVDWGGEGNASGRGASVLSESSVVKNFHFYHREHRVHRGQKLRDGTQALRLRFARDLHGAQQSPFQTVAKPSPICANLRNLRITRFMVSTAVEIPQMTGMWFLRKDDILSSCGGRGCSG
jgi:hypothetical protein